MKLAPQAMSYNGKYLEDLIPGYLTIAVGGREDTIHNVNTKEVEGLDGAKFLSKQYPSKELSISYQLVLDDPDDVYKYFKLIDRYLIDEEVHVIFDDEPDVYWIGTKTFHQISSIFENLVYGGIKIYCSDGYRYSTTLNEVEGIEEDGVTKLIFENHGNAPCAIRYEIEHTSDNGFIGLIHKNGVMQFGKINKADETDPAEGVKIFSTDPPAGGTEAEIRAAWNGWEPYTGTHPQNSNIWCGGGNALAINSSTGILYWKTRPKPSLTDKPNCSAYGGCWRYTLENPTENFYIWFYHQFYAFRSGQCGHNQITLADEDNNIIAAFALSKTDMSGHTAYARFYIGDNGHDFSANERGNSIFQTNYFEAVDGGLKKGNPYVNNGSGDIKKEGGTIRFYYSGKYWSIYNEDLANARVKYIYVFIGDHYKSNDVILIENVSKISAWDFSGSAWKDVNNKYISGTTCVIDGETGNYYVNGLLRPDDEVRGTQWFKADPGTNTIEVKFSQWAETKPTIKAYYRERWY